MAKYDVTPELAATIKAVRVQNHIASKAVAEHIGKSQSYMSKLEKGDIKTIEENELTSIFHFIFGNDESFQDFLNSSLGNILGTLELRFSDEEIARQLWFDDYDTVKRLIPVPEDLIDDLCVRMETANLSIERLCERINANEGISPKVTNTDPYPFNEWQAFVVDHQIEFKFIKMKVDPEEIRKLFSKKRTASNYVTMLSVVYYIVRIENYGDEINIPDEKDALLMQEATDYLGSYKFYSLAEKNALKRQAQTESEREAILSSFDKENSEIINELLTAFRVFSELDIKRTNKALSSFVKNLKWDSGFMIKLISMSFYEMDETSFSVKKEMISEIQAILNKYKDLPDNQKRIESYD